jgi:5-methylcytosine-specific restriction endonuclease McrA
MDDTISIDFSCVNCDQVIVVSKHAALYCSQRCHQDAKLVRYVRACIKEGRMNDPLVREAIRTRFAFAYSEKGYYDEKASQVSAAKRRQVIEREHGLCRLCGAVGSEIDHISGASQDLNNLQLLCHGCHSEKTEANMVPITPEHERYEEILARESELRARIDASAPLRPCDDETNWNYIYKELMTEQRQLLKRIKEDVEGAAKGRNPSEEERITDELNELAELQSRLEALETDKEERIRQVLTPEIQAQLQAIDEEFSNLTESLNESISAIKRRIKERTEQYGLTVKGSEFQAVWRSAAIRWDTKGLEEYSKTHPEILQFRREGRGSAAIIPVKKKQV